MINVDTKEQVADIFTKPFAENGKWFHALNLISHVEVLKPLWQKKQAPGTSRPRGQAGQFRTSLQLQLSRDKDFRRSALQSLVEAFPKSQRKRVRKMIDRNNESS